MSEFHVHLTGGAHGNWERRKNALQINNIKCEVSAEHSYRLAMSAFFFWFKMFARLCMNCFSCYSVGNKNTLIFPIVSRQIRTFIQLTTFSRVFDSFYHCFCAKRNLISGNAHFLHSILCTLEPQFRLFDSTQFIYNFRHRPNEITKKKENDLVSHRWTHSGTHATKLEQNERNGSNCWTTTKLLYGVHSEESNRNAKAEQWNLNGTKRTKQRQMTLQ